MKPELQQMKERLQTEVEQVRQRPVIVRTLVHGGLALAALWIIVDHYSVDDIEHLTGLLGFSSDEIRMLVFALIGMGGLEGILRRKKK